MCIVHNLYCGYSLSAYVIISIIMIDQNKTFRSEKSARTGPGLQAPMLVEERIRVQASRCYHKVTGPHVTRRKRERILSRFSSIHIFKDDIVQPMKIEEQLSFARMEVEESR